MYVLVYSVDVLCLQVVVLRKRDFLDLDNPLLAWMLDYDAVSAVLKSLPAFRGLKQDQMERILDRFEARQELYKGDAIISQGSLVSIAVAAAWMAASKGRLQCWLSAEHSCTHVVQPVWPCCIPV